MAMKKKAAAKKAAARKRSSGAGDAWNRNDEKLYGIMGGKNKTRYAEDQATYREFGRTYGGPTDAAGVTMRKRREAGDFSFGEKPKKRMGPSTPKRPKQGRGGNKKAGPSESMRMRKRYDDKMGYKPEFVGKPPKKNVKRGAK